IGEDKKLEIDYVTYSSKFHSLVWCEKNTLFMRTLKIEEKSKKKKKEVQLGHIKQIEQFDFPIQNFFPCKEGIWIIHQHAIHYWSYPSQILHGMDLFGINDTGKEKVIGLQEITRACVHPNTQHLFVIDQMETL